LQIEWLPTAEMPADGLTKALPWQKHNEFVRQLQLADLTTLLSFQNWLHLSFFMFTVVLRTLQVIYRPYGWVTDRLRTEYVRNTCKYTHFVIQITSILPGGVCHMGSHYGGNRNHSRHCIRILATTVYVLMDAYSGSTMSHWTTSAMLPSQNCVYMYPSEYLLRYTLLDSDIQFNTIAPQSVHPSTQYCLCLLFLGQSEKYTV
jgi:hypothetical protein